MERIVDDKKTKINTKSIEPNELTKINPETKIFMESTSWKSENSQINQANAELTKFAEDIKTHEKDYAVYRLSELVNTSKQQQDNYVNKEVFIKKIYMAIAKIASLDLNNERIKSIKISGFDFNKDIVAKTDQGKKIKIHLDLNQTGPNTKNVLQPTAHIKITKPFYTIIEKNITWNAH